MNTRNVILENQRFGFALSRARIYIKCLEH
jgi:hypothetical protein